MPLSATWSTPVEVLRQEIERFMELARQRSEWDDDRRRRGRRRYCRSWPLLICLDDDPLAPQEIGVALHNASELGIAFRTGQSIKPGMRVAVRLFWHDDTAPMIPAVVRHSTPLGGGFLIGCEFMVG